MAKHVGVTTRDYYKLASVLLDIEYELGYGNFQHLLATLKRMRIKPLPRTYREAQREYHEARACTPGPEAISTASGPGSTSSDAGSERA